MNSLPIYLGYKYFRSKKGAFASFTSLMAIAGLSLGVAALVIVLSVMNGFEKELQTRVLGVVPQLIIRSNENLINYDLLKTMKKNCIIINAARGGIIHEEDLNKALNEDLIFGAGIDVFKQEPPDNDNPLLKNDKVYLSPHTAAFTDECMTRMGVETIQNIIDYFDDTLEKSKIVRL